MKWIIRIAFTTIYLIITFYLLFKTPIPNLGVLFFIIIFITFISSKGAPAGLEDLFKNASQHNK